MDIGRRTYPIDQPLGVGRKPAHHLQGRHSILFSSGDVRAEAGRDDPLAEHVLGIEQIIEDIQSVHKHAL